MNGTVTAPAAYGDIVVIKPSLSGRRYEVLRADGLDDQVRIAPLDPQDTRDPFWVPASWVAVVGRALVYGGMETEHWLCLVVLTAMTPAQRTQYLADVSELPALA